MKSKELKNLSVEELELKLKEQRSKLLKKKVLKTTGQVEDSAEVRVIRKNIARLETFRRQKQLAASA